MTQANFLPTTLNAAERTVELIWSTGAKVKRSSPSGDFTEELLISQDALDLSALNAGAPLLNSHKADDLSDQIGVVERAWIEDGKAHALVRFSERPQVDGIFRDVASGVIRSVSVGYSILEAEESEANGETTLTATRWKPFELSLVPIPADEGAKTRSLRERYNLQESRHATLSAKAKEQTHIQRGPMEIIRDEKQTRIEAFSEVLLRRMGLRCNEDKAKKFVQMSLLDMARDMTGASFSHTPSETINRAMASSDFPGILADVANKGLLQSFEKASAEATFWPFVRTSSVRDFKPVHRYRLGEMPSLIPLAEGAEVASGSITEAQESYKIARFARMLEVTQVALINDDLSLLSQIRNWGYACARLMSQMVWGILESDQEMLNDGIPLFEIEKRKNVIKAKTLDVKAIRDGRLAMLRQKNMSESNSLNLSPEYLLVPPELELEAFRLVSATTPATQDQVNPYAGSMKVITSPWLKNDKQFYLAASNAQPIDLIELSFLNGQRSPTTESQNDFKTGNFQIKAVFDFGAKALDYRGFVRGTLG